MTMIDLARGARKGSYELGSLTEDTKNRILKAAAGHLGARRNEILEANRKDLAAAEGQDLEPSLLKRLALTHKKLDQIIEGVHQVAALPDPLGTVHFRRELDENLILEKVSVPIGVIGVIFESRPDALVQIASLALKSGNAALLKGGREALHSNRVLFSAFADALKAEAPGVAGTLVLVETREEIAELLKLDEYIDLMIPRGSNALVKYIQENTRIPVMGHADGICHMYVAPGAETEKAVALVKDAKCQYPAVCNAIETLLIHESRAEEILPLLVEAMDGVEFWGDEACRKIIPEMRAAADEDWRTEYNNLTLSVKIVSSFDEAADHINTFGSHHSDGIVTEDKAEADRFMALIDSSSVMWNASTRFADGFRYGFGAEVGISTNRIHARGPVGLEGLTTYKFRLVGTGQTVAPYASGEKVFTHRELG